MSGTTSATAMAALGLYDFQKAAKSADIIGAMSLEALKGVMNAFDARVMQVRPHTDQGDTAENVRRILAGSGIIEKYRGHRVPGRPVPAVHPPTSRRGQEDLPGRQRDHRDRDERLL